MSPSRLRYSSADETLTPPAPPGAGSVPFREYLVILMVGGFALLYLVLAWRAADLDAQAGRMEDELARARFELLQSRRELYACLTPAAVADPRAVAPACKPTGEEDTVGCPSLPTLENCVLSDLAGSRPVPPEALQAHLPRPRTNARVARNSEPR